MKRKMLRNYFVLFFVFYPKDEMSDWQKRRICWFVLDNSVDLWGRHAAWHHQRPGPLVASAGYQPQFGLNYALPMRTDLPPSHGGAGFGGKGDLFVGPKVGSDIEW